MARLPTAWPARPEFSRGGARALARFPPSPARQAMLDLVDFCVERAY